jgi:hypothetical protein
MFAIDKEIFSKTTMLKFINIIYVIFFVKYLACWILNFRIRPTVYVENNFEVMFVSTLYLIRYLLTKNNQLKFLFFLGAIILLSMSRSAILMYLMIFLFVIKERLNKVNRTAIYKTICFSAGLLLVLLLVFLVFVNRGESIEETDRYGFMSIFLYETQDWNFFQYIIGAPRITPLSDFTASRLSWCEDLFSFSGNGTCYSVILHSYILRILFDHGIIGLIYVVFFTYEILKMNRIDTKIIYILISIFLLNGLSVSSFNSVFFPISMIFLMGTQYDKRILKTERL